MKWTRLPGRCGSAALLTSGLLVCECTCTCPCCYCSEQTTLTFTCLMHPPIDSLDMDGRVGRRERAGPWLVTWLICPRRTNSAPSQCPVSSCPVPKWPPFKVAKRTCGPASSHFTGSRTMIGRQPREGGRGRRSLVSCPAR